MLGSQSASQRALSDNAFSIMVAILDQLLHWRAGDIRNLFESYELNLAEWAKDRTDRVNVSERAPMSLDPRSKHHEPTHYAQEAVQHLVRRPALLSRNSCQAFRPWISDGASGTSRHTPRSRVSLPRASSTLESSHRR